MTSFRTLTLWGAVQGSLPLAPCCWHMMMLCAAITPSYREESWGVGRRGRKKGDWSVSQSQKALFQGHWLCGHWDFGGGAILPYLLPSSHTPSHNAPRCTEHSSWHGLYEPNWCQQTTGQVQSLVCLRLASEWRVFFIFLDNFLKVRRKIIICKM